MTMVLALALLAAQASSTAARELTQFVARLTETWKKGDCAAYGAMLAPEWSVIHITGDVLTRAQVLDMCKAASDPIASFDVADIQDVNRLLTTQPETQMPAGDVPASKG